MTIKGFDNWTTTSGALHRAAGIIGILHKTLLSPRLNYLHLPLLVRPWGLASSIFPNGADDDPAEFAEEVFTGVHAVLTPLLGG